MITNKVVLREGDRRIRILLFHLNFLQTHLIFALNPCPDEAQYFGINRKIRKRDFLKTKEERKKRSVLLGWY